MLLIGLGSLLQALQIFFVGQFDLLFHLFHLLLCLLGLFGLQAGNRGSFTSTATSEAE